MSKKRKHSRAEIAAMLAQADELARQGKLQSEIARVLGISVMTLHRWRKAPATVEPSSVATAYKTSAPAPDPDQKKRIADLQLENARLRRLVTDLLLEKMKLEEAAQDPSGKRASR
jgi:putative transposase